MKHSEFTYFIEKKGNELYRDMPWRNTENPYHILVSEVMLQQTQYQRVIDKYNIFIQKFPTVSDLSRSTLREVPTLWVGLGYNRRAKFLHEASHIISHTWNGVIPDNQEILSTLPGIGINTAGAIVAYSYNIPSIFIETNIRRVYLHHYFQNKFCIHDKDITPILKKTLNTTHPRQYYWALMDYGSFLKKHIPNPNVRSKHHTKQSKFEGSDRQVRAAIVKLLTQHKQLTQEDIFTYHKHPDKRIPEILTSLVLENTLKYNNRYYSIK